MISGFSLRSGSGTRGVAGSLDVSGTLDEAGVLDSSGGLAPMGTGLEIGFGFGNPSRRGGTLFGLGNSSLGVRGGNSSRGVTGSTWDEVAGSTWDDVAGLTWDDELAEGAAFSSPRLRCRICASVAFRFASRIFRLVLSYVNLNSARSLVTVTE